MSTALRILWVVCLGAAFHESVIAQPNQVANEVDTIAWSVNLDPNIVVSATYAPTDIRNAVHKVQVIPSSAFAKRGVTQLDQVLQQHLSAQVSQDLILGSSVSLFGLGGQNVKILMDGVPIAGRVGDNVDLSQLSLQNIERIEIVEGPMAVHYGSDALAGVINLISRKGQKEKNDVAAAAQWESLGQHNANLSIGRRWSNKWTSRASFNALDFAGIGIDSTNRAYQWNPKKQYSATAMLLFQPTAGHSFRAQLDGMQENILNEGPVRRPQFKPYAFDEDFETKRLNAIVHYEGQLDNGWFLQADIGHSRFTRTRDSYRKDLTTEETLTQASNLDTNMYESWNVRPVVSWRPIHKKWKIAAGVDAQGESGTGTRIEQGMEVSQWFVALFSTFDYNVNDKLTVQAAARVSEHSDFNIPLVPSVNILYNLNSKWQLRGSLATGFRAPTLKERYFFFVDANHFILGNPTLKAERSKHVQIHLQKQSKETGWLVQGSFFYNQIQDKIQLFDFVERDGVRVPAAQVDTFSLDFTYFNIASFENFGLQTQLGYQTKKWMLNMGLSPIAFANPYYKENPGVDAYTVSWQVSTNARYSIPAWGIELTALGQYQDQQVTFFEDVDNEGNSFVNQQVRGGYALLDGSISKSFLKDKVQLTLGGRNLLNITQVTSSAENVMGPHGSGFQVPISPGRSLFVGLKCQLGW